MNDRLPVRGRDSRRGSVLIIVIWVCLGLVALTIYFANAMSSELRAADNRAAEIEAQQAVAAGTRYAGFVLRQFATGGAVPQPEDFRCEEMPVGEGAFWFVGRDNNQAALTAPTEPVFAIVDEASKLNLNSASATMLAALPGMTTELADAIVAWRRQAGEEGADAGSTYSALVPARTNKGARFESVDELRLVYGMTLDILYGEDTNRNGVLDANEDDGEQSAPRDDRDGQLFAGIAEYVTVHSRQTRTGTNGRRVNISNGQNRQQALQRLLQRQLEPGRAAAIMAAVGTRDFRSVAEFMVESQMTQEEFERVHGDLAAVDGTATGLVNVCTASETVLACIPGIGTDNAGTIVAYRQANPDLLRSMWWLQNVLPPEAIRQAGRYLTDQSYQFSVDVAAVGRNGRGYARARTVFEMSNGTPRIIYHQDLASFGWALGSQTRQTLRAQRERGT